MNFKQYVNYTDITKNLSEQQTTEVMGLFKKLDEGVSIEDMKSVIKSTLKSIQDYSVISRVFFVLNEKNFENMLNQHLLNSDLLKSPGLFDSIMAVLSKSDFEETKVFLDDLTNDKIIKNVKSVLSGTPTDLLSICNSKHKTILEKIFPKLMEAKLSNTTVGPGEVLLTFLSSDVAKADKGDLYINGKEIEVKSTDARMESAMYGYGSAPTVLMQLRTDLEMLGYSVKTKTGFSFTAQEIKQINVFLSNNKDKIVKVSKLLKNALESIMKNGYGNTLWDNIFNGKKIDEKNHLVHTHAEFFELYKKADNFQGIMFINKRTYNSLYVENGSDLVKNSKYFKLGAGPAYDKRNGAGVPQLSLKI